MRKAAAICLLAVMIPYIGTLAWTGRVEGNGGIIGGTESSDYRILLDREGTKEASVDMEEYLIGVTALQMPADYGLEALKAQSIIARTYISRQMAGKREIPESALDMDYLEQGQMEGFWGREKYLENYKKLRQAVTETRGLVIRENGECIEPLFHRLSAGKTRAGDELHPYLASVETPGDVEGEGYLGNYIFTREELAEKLNAMADSPGIQAESVLENLQIIEREEAGYVVSVQVGEKSYSGEDIRFALGLPSSAFTFEEYEGNVRCTTKGIGHGYGFDQFDASRKAGEGWQAEDILKYYYKNIVVEAE